MVKLKNSPIACAVISYAFYLGTVASAFFPDYTHVSSWPFVALVTVCAIGFYISMSRLLFICEAKGKIKYLASFVLSIACFLLTKYHFNQGIISFYSLISLAAMYVYIKDSIKLMKVKPKTEEEAESEGEYEADDLFDSLTPAQRASLNAAMQQEEKLKAKKPDGNQNDTDVCDKTDKNE